MPWNIPNIWQDGTCWIIGGGASLRTEFNIPNEMNGDAMSEYGDYMKPLHKEHVIGVNGAFMLGNWVDVCFFGDKDWYFDNRAELEDYTGVVIGCANFLQHARWTYLDVHYVEKYTGKGFGISEHKQRVCWNKSSGAAAISLAYLFGCRRIILLGFDMQNTGTRSHFHNLYDGAQIKQEVFDKHLKCWDQIAADAQRLGVEILNASEHSVITHFKKVKALDLL